MTISHTTFRRASIAALLGLGLVAVSAPVQATGNFDGKWSVVVVTEKGDCDRAYRYPIDIRNATLINAGNTSFDISGKVLFVLLVMLNCASDILSFALGVFGHLAEFQKFRNFFTSFQNLHGFLMLYIWRHLSRCVSNASDTR